MKRVSMKDGEGLFPRAYNETTKDNILNWKILDLEWI